VGTQFEYKPTQPLMRCERRRLKLETEKICLRAVQNCIKGFARLRDNGDITPEQYRHLSKWAATCHKQDTDAAMKEYRAIRTEGGGSHAQHG